jgi:hypothetical protein
VPFQIDLSAEGITDAYQQLQPWEQRSLEAALLAASADPQRLPALPQESEHARILGFADGRGLCLLDVDEDGKRLIVRLIEPPR